MVVTAPFLRQKLAFPWKNQIETVESIDFFFYYEYNIQDFAVPFYSFRSGGEYRGEALPMVFIWAMMYGITYKIARHFPGIFPFAMTLYTGLLILWIHRTGKSRDLWLCGMKKPRAKDLLHGIPLFLLPLYNLSTGTNMAMDIPQLVFILCAAVVEELFFRGFALNFFQRKGRASGVLLSSGLFALFHWVNLFQGGNFPYTLIQTLCAFVVGVCYCAAVIRWGSLVPCFLAHICTNLTGFAAKAPVGFESVQPGLWLCIAACAGYGIWFCRGISPKKVKENSL